MLREEERKRRNRKGSNCSIYIYRWLQWGQKNSKENNTDLHDQGGGRGNTSESNMRGDTSVHGCPWGCRTAWIRPGARSRLHDPTLHGRAVTVYIVLSL